MITCKLIGLSLSRTNNIQETNNAIFNKMQIEKVVNIYLNCFRFGGGFGVNLVMTNTNLEPITENTSAPKARDGTRDEQEPSINNYLIRIISENIQR